MNGIAERIRNHAQEAEQSWGSAYGRFGKVLQRRNLHRGAEIGVAFGGHSESILQFSSVEKLYGIDPYKHDPNYIDAMNLPQEEFDELFLFTTTRLSKFGDRYEHIRKPSKLAVEEISGQLDFVYIDVDHSYTGALEDICVWFNKVRDGGIIGGHDYDHPDLLGVKQAVDRYFSRFGWQIHTEGETVWWVEKQKINISFIIPAYNCETTLEESVNSIYDGNMSEGDEIIIVNDASSDNTQEVIEKLRKNRPEIRTYQHSFNKGGGAARNTAIENTKHPIIFCLDSDNILESNSVSNLLNSYILSDNDIVTFGEVNYFNSKDHKNSHHRWIYKKGIISLSDYLSGTISPGSSGNYLYSKKSWMDAGRYPEYCFMDTWGFGLFQLANGSKMYTLPNTYYYHRIGHDSYWIRESTKRNTSLIVLQLLIPFLNRIDEKDIDYIMGRKNRYKWFDHLAEHPLQIDDMPLGNNGYEEYSKTPVLEKKQSSLKRMARKIFRIINNK